LFREICRWIENGQFTRYLDFRSQRFTDQEKVFSNEKKTKKKRSPQLFEFRYYVKIFVDEDIFGKTTSKERREILFWGENFLFKDIPEGCSNVRCKIYRENDKRKQKQVNGFDSDLIGWVDIPLSTITGNQFVEQWYPLQISNGKEKSQKTQENSISIRIKSKYQPIEILPIDSYLHLQEVDRTDFVLSERNTSFFLVYSSKLSSIN